ncbi:MAG: thiamine pyrophosphate-dependent enzyme, partial [Pseudomonadota bacterium]
MTDNVTNNRIQRRKFVGDLLERRAGALVVPGLGSPTWDCFAAGDSPEYLYSWGGMGQAVPTALGLALAQPERRILVLTGDGEMLMGVGSLGVVANQAPSNLSGLGNSKTVGHQVRRPSCQTRLLPGFAKRLVVKHQDRQIARRLIGDNAERSD